MQAYAIYNINEEDIYKTKQCFTQIKQDCSVEEVEKGTENMLPKGKPLKLLEDNIFNTGVYNIINNASLLAAKILFECNQSTLITIGSITTLDNQADKILLLDYHPKVQATNDKCDFG